MATLIKPDGTLIDVHPENGTDFSLSELQELVDGYIEIINLRNGEILVINEEGKGQYDINKLATDIALGFEAIFPNDFIVGDVLLCKNEQVQ